MASPLPPLRPWRARLATAWIILLTAAFVGVFVYERLTRAWLYPWQF